MDLYFALYNNVNPKSKSTAVLEIMVMLVIAAILGYLLRWYQTVDHTASSSNGDGFVSDNLQKIEGIGAKIESLLNDAGIKTFEDLAAAPKAQLKEILENAGPRYQMHDPSSWTKQARLAADGDWDKLEDLQAKLTAGRS